MIPLMKTIQERYIDRDRESIGGCQGIGVRENWEKTFNMDEVLFQGDENVTRQKPGRGGSCTTL